MYVDSPNFKWVSNIISTFMYIVQDVTFCLHNIFKISNFLIYLKRCHYYQKVQAFSFYGVVFDIKVLAIMELTKQQKVEVVKLYYDY